MGGVVQRHRLSGSVLQFDERILAGGGMIVDFVDHHRSDNRRAVGGFIGLARRGHEVHVAGALDVADETDAGVARRERLVGLEVGQHARGGGSRMNVAAQLAESEGRDAAGVGRAAEIVARVEGLVAVSRNHGAGGDLKFLQVAVVVAQVPAAYVNGRGGGVVEFDPIAQRIRLVGAVGEQFVDDDGVGGVRGRLVGARRAIGRMTGEPAFALAPQIAVGGRGVADYQRIAAAVGLLVPVVLVAEIEDDFAGTIDERQLLARFRQVGGAKIGRGPFPELSGDDAVIACPVPRLERRLIRDDQHAAAGGEAGDAAAGEVERHAVGELHAAKAQCLRRADVFQLDVLKIIARITAARRVGGMIHQFGDSQVLLRQRGIARCSQRRHEVVLGIDELDRLSPLRQVALIVALYEESLTAGGPGRAMAEGVDIRRNVERSAGGDHHAVFEGEIDATLQFPAGKVESYAHRIDQGEILLVLVPRCRRNLVGTEIDRQMRGLRGGNAGVIGVAGVRAVIDIQVRAAGIEILGLDVVVIGTKIAQIADDHGIAHQFGVDRVELVLEIAVGVGRAGRFQQLVHQRPQPPQVHLFDGGDVEQRIDHPIVGTVDLAMVRIAEERMRVGIADLIICKTVVLSEGQVLVPGDHRPFVGAIGVGVIVSGVRAVVGIAIEVVVFRHVVVVQHERVGRQIIEHHRDVDVVVNKVAASRGVAEVQSVEERLEISGAGDFIAADLGEGGGGSVGHHVGVAFVDRAVLVNALAIQKPVVGLLDEIHHHVIGVVPLHPHGKDDARRIAGCALKVSKATSGRAYVSSQPAWFRLIALTGSSSSAK